MSYYNTRRTVEALVIPFSFIAVVGEGSPTLSTQSRAELINQLTQAAADLLPRGLTDKERSELHKRTRALVQEVVLTPFRALERDDPFERQKQAMRLGMTLYYFLKNMVDQRAYSISEGCTFDVALTQVLDMLSQYSGDEGMDTKTFETSRLMHAEFQRRGYLTDVEWIIEYKSEL